MNFPIFYISWKIFEIQIWRHFVSNELKFVKKILKKSESFKTRTRAPEKRFPFFFSKKKENDLKFLENWRQFLRPGENKRRTTCHANLTKIISDGKLSAKWLHTFAGHFPHDPAGTERSLPNFCCCFCLLVNGVTVCLTTIDEHLTNDLISKWKSHRGDLGRV